MNSPTNPFKLQGYEKFWSVLLGGGMATATVTLVLWGLSGVSDQIPPLTSEAIVAAITGVIVTFFNAANVYVTANTTSSGEVAGGEADLEAKEEEAKEEKAEKTIEENPTE
jgi:hypothetical protein